MIQNKQYVKRNIAGTAYLFPIGQAIADRKHGVQLNETGSFLWDLLAVERSFDDILSVCASHYGFTDEELPTLKENIESFLSYFIKNNIILLNASFEPASTYYNHNYYRTLKIAGLKCMLFGPAEAFSDNLLPFLEDGVECPDQTIQISTKPIPFHENGVLLLRNKELVVLDCDTKYILMFPASPQINEVHLQKDGSFAFLYCNAPFDDAFRENLFHALRMVFLYLAQMRGMVALHSASLYYCGKAWLFSGPAGTGKSTHTNLWKDLYQTSLINGDLNLLAMEANRPVVHGIPWCGTSGIFDTRTYPLGGIILLKQSPDNRIEDMSTAEKQLATMQRFISPMWNDVQLDYNLTAAAALADNALICRLHCNVSKDAVDTIKHKIDEYLSLE